MADAPDGERSGSPSERLRAFAVRVAPRVPDRTAELDAGAVAIFSAFEQRGIDGVLLKGPALEQVLYPPGESRRYGDVDVLVAPAQLDLAREVLRTLGYRNVTETLGIDDVAGVVHEESWVGRGTESDHELVVELHLWFAGARAEPELAWQALAAHRVPLQLEAGRVPVLDREGLALNLATHAAQHGPQYVKGLNELSLGLERWPADVWKRAAGLAHQLDAGSSFAAGLRLIPAGEALAERLGLPHDEAVEWDVIHGRSRPRGMFHLDALGSAASLTERARLVRRALVPQRDWLLRTYPWAWRSRPRLAVAYAIHIVRVPLWAVRGWRFSRRRRHSREPGRSG